MCWCVVSSSRYDGQSSGAIEVISPASSPAQREEKNDRSFSSEKSSQPAPGENIIIVDLDCVHYRMMPDGFLDIPMLKFFLGDFVDIQAKKKLFVCIYLLLLGKYFQEATMHDWFHKQDNVLQAPYRLNGLNRKLMSLSLCPSQAPLEDSISLATGSKWNRALQQLHLHRPTGS